MNLKDKENLELELEGVILKFLKEHKDVPITKISINHKLDYEKVCYYDGSVRFQLINYGSSIVKISI